MDERGGVDRGGCAVHEKMVGVRGGWGEVVFVGRGLGWDWMFGGDMVFSTARELIRWV